MEWTIAKETGWTLDYIRWKVRFVQLVMMLGDAPRMLTKKERAELKSQDEILSFLGKA